MSDALIGHSGFVGGAIQRHRSFDSLYRSTNIGDIADHSFDTVVCCGAPAEKWRANKDPDKDRERLRTLTDALARVQAKRFILISTVDVYPAPVGVDENTTIDPARANPYGRHRFELELFCRARFDAVIVRLPALFGRGLKKNAIFDLLHDRPMDAMPGNAKFQFYDAERTWSDVERIAHAGLKLANITSEPVTMTDVAQRAFGRELPTLSRDNAPLYDVRSVHAGLVSGRNGYWFDAATVMDGIVRFVSSERKARA